VSRSFIQIVEIDPRDGGVTENTTYGTNIFGDYSPVRMDYDDVTGTLIVESQQQVDGQTQSRVDFFDFKEGVPQDSRQDKPLVKQVLRDGGIDVSLRPALEPERNGFQALDPRDDLSGFPFRVRSIRILNLG